MKLKEQQFNGTLVHCLFEIYWVLGIMETKESLNRLNVKIKTISIVLPCIP